jgi:O-antigen/teichoic acid export membrane protein
VSTTTERRAAPPGAVRHDLAWLARGGILNLAGVVSNAVAGFALVVIVTRALGEASAGLFFESIALFAIGATVAGWGADVGAVRMIPRALSLGRRDEIRHVILAAALPAAVLGAVLGLVVFAAATPLGRLLSNATHGDELASALRALAPFLPIGAVFAVAMAVTRGFGTMLPFTLIDRVVRALAQPMGVVAAIAVSGSIAVITVAWAIPFAVGLVLALAWIALKLRRGPDDGIEVGIDQVGIDPDVAPRSPRAVFGDFWRFTAPRGLASVFAVTVVWLDTLLLGALRSPADAAAYAAATRYLVFGQFIGVAIANVVAPKLAQVLAEDHRDRAKTLYATATWWLMTMAWPVYLAMIGLAPSLLVVFGSGYGRAAGVLAILGATMLVATFVGPVDMVLLMAGKSSWNLINTAIAVVVNVGLNLALIPRFGLVGAAVAWSASILLNNLLPLVQVWRTVGLHPIGRGSLIVAVAAPVCVLGASWIARTIAGDGITTIVLAVAIATPPYVAVLWRWRRSLHLDSLRDALRRRSITMDADPELS